MRWRVVKKLRVCSGDGRARGKIVGRYVCDASSRVDFGSSFKSLAMESVEMGSAMMWKCKSTRDHPTPPRSDGIKFS
jgi:hypothetical protein